MNEENMKYYKLGKKVPEKAQKKIGAGRLAGMTNINPMWRIEKLTELFGPCGEGWYYEIVSQEIREGSEDQKVAFVNINLYVKFPDGWSKPIVGIGGSSFVAKERSGLYTSDECFKMALTDALSIACKALGIGADVWYNNDEDNKYSREPEQTPYDVLNDKKASANQVEILKKVYVGENLEKLLKKCGVKKVKDISMSKASEIIKALQVQAKKKKEAAK